MTLRLRHDQHDPARMASLAQRAGRRVGLAGVLDALDRQAHALAVPGRRVEWGFGWEREDAHSRQWWPQGITSTSEAGPTSAYAGRDLLVTSWYAKPVDGSRHGSRLSVVDLATLRYRHVLLVQPKPDGSWFTPLRVHAGGLAWSGSQLLVAATRTGIFTASVDDVVEVDEPGRFFGYRFVLPVGGLLRAEQDEAEEPLRYSFCSMERPATGPPRLHVGEYGRNRATRRLAHFPVDPQTDLPVQGPAGCEACDLAEGPAGMQGVAVVDGVRHLTTSHGTQRPGTLHVGARRRWWPRLRAARRGALPVGPEDLTWWPEQGLLWSLSEHPGHRYVYAVRPSR